MEARIIDAKAAAKLLSVHIKTVYKLAETGKIPARRIGRCWRFNEKDLIALFDGGGTP